MIKATGVFVTTLLIFIILFSFTLFSFSRYKGYDPVHTRQIKNHAPVVKILSPKNNSSYNFNSQVAYQITVSDKEDGDSKYQEINPKEVFLKIKYVNDTAKALELTRKNEEDDAEGLSIIKTTNCMNCHAFRTKLIGPSFYDITRRYTLISTTEDTLVNHILNGSKGRWGNVQMPSNNKLNSEEAKKVIAWLFKNASDSTTIYLAGTEGSFRLRPPAASLKNAILIASYTDHGLKDNPGQNLRGQDAIILQVK
jgi:cytochrome c